MKIKRHLIYLLTLASAFSAHASEDGVVDLTQLANYANQPVPNYIQRDNTPANNPITDLGATLGKVLFYDKRLSLNDTISCASCHKQENAFSDVDIASTGVNGTTGRHSMRLINNRFSQDTRRFWDERAATLEIQATQPIQDHVEMGFSGADGDPDFSQLVTKLSAIEEYQVLFVGIYGDSTISELRIQRALGQFIRSIQSFDSKYDDGRSQVNDENTPFPNFTADENAGKALFNTPPGRNGGAGCAACHRAPEFDIGPNSGNNGVIGSLGGGTDLTNTRSPSLRDLVSPTGASHGGFMHDASLATLEDVIDHYDSIDTVNPQLDQRLANGPGSQGQQLNLTAQEKSQLVAFLKSLTGNSVYEDVKFADPFDANGEISLVMFPVEGGEMQMSGSGETRQMTITTSGVPNVDYVLQSSTDLENWSDTPVTADTAGVITMNTPAPESAQKMFFRITYNTAAP